MNVSKIGRDNKGRAAGESAQHESAHLHVTGEAAYVDDMPELDRTVHGAFGLSQHAHARLKSVDLSHVLAAPGVVAVITAADVPGSNDFGAAVADDPILAPGLVQFVGQPIFLVAALTVMQARRAAKLAVIEYEDLPAILTTEEALAQQSFVMPSFTAERGDAHNALSSAPYKMRGRFRVGGQEHFYLEGQIAYAVPRESGEMLIYSSTQHPGVVQLKVAQALGVAAHKVTVWCRRMGGGFGGKESQPSMFACAAAVMARHLNRPVKLRLDRDDDLLITGKRHDFLIDYNVGFDASGHVLGLDLMLASRCGYSADLSRGVNDRAVTHVDNCYYLPNLRIVSHRCKTHTQSNTAFRGYGAPQGIVATEYVLDEVARYLGRDPLEVRKTNLYVTGERDTTHYNMKIEDFVADKIIEELERTSEYACRREAIRRWNANSPVIKRGLALTPAKHGIGYTALCFNQASAVVHVYTDGSILVNHGGTEMGQGLFTRVAQIVASEFGVDLERIQVSASDTSKIPNASPTSASSGVDINGKAAQAAAREIKERLVAFAAKHFDVNRNEIDFHENEVCIGSKRVPFSELIHAAYLARIQLWASGFYKTPKVGFDRDAFKGRPYLYFAYGAAVSEVAIDTLTGELRLLRVDVLHDVGRSLNPALDIGQIEGGFIQGTGWLTTEELCWNDKGKLMTHAPSTYKIPVASDVPAAFHCRIWERGMNTEDTIYRSKAVGEPPLLLAISVFCAIKDAVAAACGYKLSPRLNAPATPEEILLAVNDLKARARVATADADVNGVEALSS